MTTSEHMHATSFDDGRVVVYSRFQPGDTIETIEESTRQVRLVVSVWPSGGAANYTLETPGVPGVSSARKHNLAVSLVDRTYRIVKPLGFVNVYPDKVGAAVYTNRSDADRSSLPERTGVLVIHHDGTTSIDSIHNTNTRKEETS